MDERVVDWSQLPKELWPLITQHLNTTIDVLRFRSVCKSWRSSLPLPPSHSLPLFSPQIRIRHANYFILQTKIYRLEPRASQDPSTSSSGRTKGWIIKVGDSKPVPLRLLDPFTNFRLSHQRFPFETPPKVLNLINFRVVELIEAYTIDMGGDLLDNKDEDELGFYMPVSTIRKVVLFPSFHMEGRLMFALYTDGKLGVSKIGDENWTILDDGKQQCDDIILHKGQVYVVDNWGTVLWIDCSSFKLVQFSPYLFGFGKRKHLVESGGSLYVVDMYIEGDPDNPKGGYWEVIDIKVYKLDEEWGRWLDVKDLGDVLFILGKESNFSLSAQDYYGCEGNCIYFYSEGRDRGFSLKNSKFRSPDLFWPYPTLFDPKFNLYV